MSGQGAGPGDSGGTELALDASTAGTIAGCHDLAAGRITDLTRSVPTVDGGYAAGDLLRILDKVRSTANTLAVVNQAAADQVRSVGDHLAGTDSEVASTFGAFGGNEWAFEYQNALSGSAAQEPAGNLWGVTGGGPR